MNHYINLLEPSECHYLNSAEENPLYKLVGIGLVVAFIGWNVFSYQRMVATAREGEEIQAWINENKSKVGKAKDRIAIQVRMEEARKTLEGWNAARYEFPDIFNAMARNIPPPADQVQFTYMFFNEKLIGLSTPRTDPQNSQSKFFPLERAIKLELRGIVGGSRPDLKLDAYRASLNEVKDQLPLQHIIMRLGETRETSSPEGDEITLLTPFSAEITLTPLTVLP